MFGGQAISFCLAQAGRLAVPAVPMAAAAATFSPAPLWKPGMKALRTVSRLHLAAFSSLIRARIATFSLALVSNVLAVTSAVTSCITCNRVNDHSFDFVRR